MTDWRKAWREDDLEELERIYTEDALIHLPDGRVLRGQAGRLERLGGLLPGFGEIQMSVLDFDASGRMGYLYGDFEAEQVGEDGQRRR